MQILSVTSTERLLKEIMNVPSHRIIATSTDSEIFTNSYKISAPRVAWYKIAKFFKTKQYRLFSKYSASTIYIFVM
jgi:hypothetical protein